MIFLALNSGKSSRKNSPKKSLNFCLWIVYPIAHSRSSDYEPPVALSSLTEHRRLFLQKRIVKVSTAGFEASAYLSAI